jgi:hypothetical protein
MFLDYVRKSACARTNPDAAMETISYERSSKESRGTFGGIESMRAQIGANALLFYAPFCIAIIHRPRGGHKQGNSQGPCQDLAKDGNKDWPW